MTTPFMHLVQQAARATTQAHRCLSGLQLALACPVLALKILLASLGSGSTHIRTLVSLLPLVSKFQGNAILFLGISQMHRQSVVASLHVS